MKYVTFNLVVACALVYLILGPDGGQKVLENVHALSQSVDSSQPTDELQGLGDGLSNAQSVISKIEDPDQTLDEQEAEKASGGNMRPAGPSASSDAPAVMKPAVETKDIAPGDLDGGRVSQETLSVQRDTQTPAHPVEKIAVEKTAVEKTVKKIGQATGATAQMDMEPPSQDQISQDQQGAQAPMEAQEQKPVEALVAGSDSPSLPAHPTPEVVVADAPLPQAQTIQDEISQVQVQQVQNSQQSAVGPAVEPSGEPAVEIDPETPMMDARTRRRELAQMVKSLETFMEP